MVQYVTTMLTLTNQTIWLFYLFIIGFIAHIKLQMVGTRVANKVNSVAKGQ